MKKICEVWRLGLMPYLDAWKLQEQWAQDIACGQRPPTLLLLEHNHTFTFGRRGDMANLLWDAVELTRRGVELHWVDRGGDVTYHGPGQLVGYPLLPLGSVSWKAEVERGVQGDIPRVDYVGYVRKLEKVLILALSSLGVSGEQVQGRSGIWVRPHAPSCCVSCSAEVCQLPAKIASIGVKVDARGISRHGFALNVHPDMSYWRGIVPCGLAGIQMASLADVLPIPPSIEQVMDAVVASFGTVFDFEMVSGS